MFRTCPRNLEEDRPILPAEQCGAGSLLSSNIRFMCTPCPEKKHPEHYRLSLEKGIPNHNNFRYEYFCHSWPSNNRSIFHLTQCVSALPGESRTNKTWVKMNRNMPKSIRNTIDCDFKKNWQILIIFGANIFDITFHQMTDLVPTSPNVCFCTTWKNLKKGKR